MSANKFCRMSEWWWPTWNDRLSCSVTLQSMSHNLTNCSRLSKPVRLGTRRKNNYAKCYKVNSLAKRSLIWQSICWWRKRWRATLKMLLSGLSVASSTLNVVSQTKFNVTWSCWVSTIQRGRRGWCPRVSTAKSWIIITTRSRSKTHATIWLWRSLFMVICCWTVMRNGRLKRMSTYRTVRKSRAHCQAGMIRWPICTCQRIN